MSFTAISVIAKLETTRAKVTEICEASGIPGASIGVIHHGSTIFTHNYGFSRLAPKSLTTSDTVYGIGSITKSFISAVIGQLVDQKILGWDTPVREVLPEFSHNNAVITEMTTITDILSHRCGLSSGGAMSLAFQGDGDMLLQKESLFELNHVPTLFPFRQDWKYFVWGYSLAGAIIEKVTGKRLKEVMSEAIFQPLAMSSTSFSPADLGELADPHVGLSDGSVFSLPKLQVFEDTFFEASGGIYSSLTDQLKWASTLLESIHAKTRQPPVIKQAPYIFSPHIPVLNPSISERSYALGWIRTQLPGVVGLVGDNSDLWELEASPVLGTKETPLFMLYHHGSTVGYHAFTALFPDTDSAVVVLVNSNGVSDASDWIGRLFIKVLFGFDDGNDYVALAKEANRRVLAKFDEVETYIREKKRSCSALPSHDTNAFIGRFVTESGLFFVDILEHRDGSSSLKLRFQGLEDQTYELRHLCGDVFEWALTHDESKRRGRYSETEAEYYLFRFQEVEDGKAASFTWAISEPPVVFYRI